MSFEIGPARPGEWTQIVRWAAAEGWNPGRHDAEHFLTQDSPGFLLGREDGEVVSAISVVNYSPDYAFLGFYLVRPDRRGQGLGIATWKAGMAHAAGRSVGLDGVPDQQDNYRRSGFMPAYTTVRYSGVPDTGKDTGAHADAGAGGDTAAGGAILADGVDPRLFGRLDAGLPPGRPRRVRGAVGRRPPARHPRHVPRRAVDGVRRRASGRGRPSDRTAPGHEPARRGGAVRRAARGGGRGEGLHRCPRAAPRSSERRRELRAHTVVRHRPDVRRAHQEPATVADLRRDVARTRLISRATAAARPSAC